MDKIGKKFSQFFEAYLMEKFKERLIKGGRLLTGLEAKEVFDRTLELFSSGKYKPDPDLERYLNTNWWDGADGNDLRGLGEACKKMGVEREKLRNKFLKERELAESEDSNRNDRGKERSG